MASTFTFVVRPGSFTGRTLAEANEAARSYAESQAHLRQFCLSAIDPAICVGDVYASFVSTAGPGSGIIMAVTSGALPPGITFVQGVLSGVPSVTGLYSFTIMAQDGFGNYATRDYTIQIVGITTTSLPNATQNSAYSATVSVSGFSNPFFEIVGGSLPDGLSMNSSTGAIFGIPTVADTFDFVVQVSEGVGGTPACIQELSIEVVGAGVVNIAYWTLNNANPLINTDPITGDLINVTTSFAFGSSPSSIPAVISNGVCWNATQFANGCDGIIYQQSNNIAYQGNGFSIAFWIKIDSGTITLFATASMLYSFYPNLGDLTYKLEWSGLAAVPGDGQINLNGNSFPLALPGLDAFFFCVLVVDAAGDLSTSINGAALTLLGNGGVMPAQPAATAQLALHGSIIFASATAPFFTGDEVALFSGALSDAQVAYLYNAGAGRTYPLTLP